MDRTWVDLGNPICSCLNKGDSHLKHNSQITYILWFLFFGQTWGRFSHTYFSYYMPPLGAVAILRFIFYSDTPSPASNWRRLLLIQNFTCRLKLKRNLTELYISVIITLRKKLEMHWQKRNAFWTSYNIFQCNWYLQNKLKYYIYIYIYIYTIGNAPTQH